MFWIIRRHDLVESSVEDPGLFGHPDPGPKRAKHRPKSSDIILEFSEEDFFFVLIKYVLPIKMFLTTLKGIKITYGLRTFVRLSSQNNSSM